MSRVWYIFFLIIMAFFVLMLMFTQFGYNATQSMRVDTINTATNDSLQYARDDSSRAYRGLYVVNKTAFGNHFSRYKINNLGGFGIIQDQGKQKGFYAVRFIKDNNLTDKSNINNVNTYAKEANKDDIPIRGVQVILLPFETVRDLNNGKDKSGTRYSISQNNYQSSVLQVQSAEQKGDLPSASKYVSTIIVQSDSKDAKVSDSSNDAFQSNNSNNQVNQHQNPDKDVVDLTDN